MFKKHFNAPEFSFKAPVLTSSNIVCIVGLSTRQPDIPALLKKKKKKLF